MKGGWKRGVECRGRLWGQESYGGYKCDVV